MGHYLQLTCVAVIGFVILKFVANINIEQHVFISWVFNCTAQGVIFETC